MTVLHVKQQGAVVRRDGERLKVTWKNAESGDTETLAHQPVREVEQVVVYGNVQVTTQAAVLQLEHEVDLVFLSLYGKFRGRLTKGGSKFARLRHAQMQYVGDEQMALALAKKIVKAKLSNQAAILGQVQKERGLPREAARVAKDAIAGIEKMASDSQRAGTADILRGFEGKAGAYYFQAFRVLLDASWHFEGRKFYPAPDPFNALLSFGYALLQKDCSAMLNLVGLDPYLGCFHALEDGRPSLTLDLMEEFRPLLVDHVMLNLVQDGQIKPEDFTYTKNKKRPVSLGPEGITQVIQCYEGRMDDKILHTASQQQQTIRRSLELQARVFAQVVMKERKEYVGVAIGGR